MGKSVWIQCPCCGSEANPYLGKWTLVCRCGRMLYIGPSPIRLQFIDWACPPGEGMLI